ncbi:hypothetical protein MMSP_1834 [Mycobacterium sp. 012931]|nr:hypothetical protein MMSP_1834 [Mycobacterium sp. 012931]
MARPSAIILSASQGGSATTFPQAVTWTDFGKVPEAVHLDVVI